MTECEGSNLVMVTSEDHSKWVVHALGKLFDSKRGADFDFRWDGRSARTHRIILELFFSPEIIGPVGNRQEDAPVFKQEVPDHDDDDGERNSSELDSLLEFLYKGEVAVPKNKLEDLLRLAKDLNFQMLVDALQSYCSKDAEIGNVSGFKNEDSNDGYEYVGESNHSSAVESCSDNGSGSSTRIEEENVSRIEHQSQKVVERQREYDSDCSEYQNSESDTDPTCSDSKQWQTSGMESETERVLHREDEVIRPVNLVEVQFGDENDGGAPEFDSANAAADARNSEIHRLYECLHCSYKTAELSKSDYHLLSVHGITGTSDIKRHKCAECEYRCKNICHLRRHIQAKHRKEKLFSCELCSYSGSHKYVLQRHLNVVHGQGECKFTCETCGKRCATRVHLEQHNITHTNERPFKCLYCGYASNKKGNLSSHVRHYHGETSGRQNLEVANFPVG